MPGRADGSAASAVHLRPLRSDDYDQLIGRLDEWWGGRPMVPALPRLFFDHFSTTSRVAVDSSGATVGFIVGFQSQTESSVAYIHFVGVDPALRGASLGRTLYEWFFDNARSLGCSKVKCITSPVNVTSIAFHRAMGFSTREVADYDGPGQARVVFERSI